MKAVILQEDLSKWLGYVGRIVAARGQLPVLSNVLIEAEKEGVVLSATNLELGLRVEAGGKVTEEGAITIPARNLGEFTASLGPGAVTLSSSGDKLKVENGKITGNFAGIPAQEFPAMPKMSEKTDKRQRIKVSKKILLDLARQVAFAAASDESRPVLTGIRFSVTDGKLLATATDGFRLSKKTVEGEFESGKALEEDLILPAKSIAELSRIINEGKKDSVVLEIVTENNQVIFAYPPIHLISRVLEGNFPDIEKIIPAEHKTLIILDKEELTRAVRAAAIFARDNSNIIKFKIQNSKFKVYASAQQTGESEIEIDAESEGEDAEIAFNYRYVTEFLNSCGTERVILKINGSMAPGVWMGEGDESLTHLIMPVRL